MQVLGDLIRLPTNEERGLPLPWWHRAPLGLSNKTSVFVALTVPGEGRPVADLVLTVLNPSKWSQMFKLDCFRKDAPGVVADVVRTVPPLNIALAETVKLEKGDLHHVTLICEPVYDGQDTVAERSRITTALEEDGFDVQTADLPALPELAWNRSVEVEHGWVKGVNWRQEISKKYPDTASSVDLNKVVVSADTESRVLRFVFPRRGAMTLNIRHADEPGALAEITSALRSHNLNILSSLLRRGGGSPRDAELVAVCEPVSDLSEAVIKMLKQDIEEHIPQKFRPQASITQGRYAEDTIYSRHPEETVARVPRNLSGPVRDQKGRITGEAIRLRTKVAVDRVLPVFLSCRFSENTQGSRTLEDVRDALRANGCVLVEAESTVAREPITIYTDVSSKMWASQAGVFLVAKEPDAKHISINVAHELGFLLGQGKKVLMLVEDDPSCIEVMNSFANIAGVLFERFQPHVAHDNVKSIHSIVKLWTTQLREEFERP